MIRPATLRDASWVTAHLRPSDKLEAFCQLRPGVTTGALAHWLVMSSDAYIAYRNEQPMWLFGTGALSGYHLGAWALGVTGSERLIPEVSRFFVRTIIPQRMSEGYLSMEARALAGVEAVDQWLKSMGGVPHGSPYPYGGGGEVFQTYRFTIDRYNAIVPRWGRQDDEHVLLWRRWQQLHRTDRR